MLYTRDPRTGEHLVIDGTHVSRYRTRAEALEIASRRYEAQCRQREVDAATGRARSRS